MKITTLYLFIFLSSFSFGLFETWTSSDGRTANMELIKVEQVNNEYVGSFRLMSGQTINLQASKLDAEGSKKLEDWASKNQASTTTQTEASISVFDKYLDGNLLKLEGSKLEKYELKAKPTKYYLFYYTASWCPPCRKFTPSLVEFYESHKDESFEVILITSDTKQNDMEKYAATANMPFPQLNMRDVKKFNSEFNHPGGGIPNLVLTDLKGNIIEKSYEGEDYIGPTHVLKEFKKLLKK